MNAYYFKRKSSLESYKDSLDLIVVTGKDFLLASDKLPNTMIQTFWVGENPSKAPLKECKDHYNKLEHICTVKNTDIELHKDYLVIKLEPNQNTMRIWKETVNYFKNNPDVEITLPLKIELLYKKLHPNL